MKTRIDERRRPFAIAELPAGFCHKLEVSLGSLKEQLVARYKDRLPGRGDLARELITEAETLAWETPFPHLLLPDFAELRLAEELAVEQQASARAA